MLGKVKVGGGCDCGVGGGDGGSNGDDGGSDNYNREINGFQACAAASDRRDFVTAKSFSRDFVEMETAAHGSIARKKWKPMKMENVPCSVYACLFLLRHR